MCPTTWSAALSGIALEFGVALERYHHGAHLIALGEHDLVELALLKHGEQAVKIAHRLADGGKLGV